MISTGGTTTLGLYDYVKVHNNLSGRDGTAAHPSGSILDAAGKTQQVLNEMLLNTNLMYRGAVPNQNTTSIHNIVETLANSLNDGDTLIIPSGTWYWNGQARITKQINIECHGVLNMAFRSGSPSLLFKGEAAFTYNAVDFVTSIDKGAKKLNLTTTFNGNLSDYYVVLESTEVNQHRAGFDEDYLKVLCFDITKDDFTLRDPLPFGISNLGTATLKLIKKRPQVSHKGLKINVTGTSGTTVRGNCIMYSYVSNISVIDGTLNQGKNGEFGSCITLDNSYNIQHESQMMLGERVQLDTTYNFLIYNSSYSSFHKCSNLQRGTGAYSAQSGISSRYGYMTLVDNCNFSRVDDHWGYDLTVLNSHLENGVIMAGGSVTLKNCTGDILFLQRADPPYNDGTLTIENCNYHSNMIHALGHTDSVWVSKDYGARKFFDVINISNVTQIASMSNQERGAVNQKMILMRDPQLDEVNVFRDTVLNINNATLMNDVSGVNPIPLIDCYNESEDKIYLNYDKKRMFSSINLTNVKSLFLNGANPWRVGVTPVCDILNISEGCQNIEFLRMRARKINILNGSISNVGTGDRFFDCETLTISGMDLSQLTTSLAHIAKANRYYQNTDVYIYNSKLPSQSYVWNAFTKHSTAVVEGINLKVATGNSIVNYDMSGRGDAFIPDVRNYNSDLIVRYATPSIITLAAGAESAIYELNFPQVKAADSVVGRFDIQQDISVTVVAPTSYNNGRNKVYYKMKNTSTGSITIPAGEFLTFRIV